MKRKSIIVLMATMALSLGCHICDGHLPPAIAVAENPSVEQYSRQFLAMGMPYNWNHLATSADGKQRIILERGEEYLAAHRVFDVAVLNIATERIDEMISIHEVSPDSGPVIRCRWSDDSRSIRLKGSTLRYSFGRERFDFDLLYLDGKFYDMRLVHDSGRHIIIDDEKPANNAIKLPVRSVTALASATAAPFRTAAYGKR